MPNLHAVVTYPSAADFIPQAPPHLFSKLILHASIAYTQQPWGTILLQELAVNGFTIGIYNFEILSYCEICFGFSKPLVALQYALTGFNNPTDAAGYPFQHLHHGLFYLPASHSITIHFQAGQYQFWQIHYTLSLVQKFTIAHPDFIEFQQPQQLVNHFLSASLPIDKRSRSLLLQVEHSLMEIPLNPYHINIHCLDLLMRFITAYKHYQLQQNWSSKKNNQLQNLEQLIQDHLSKPSSEILTVDMLAKKLNITTYQLKKLCANTYNTSPLALITKARMNIAILMLAQGNLSITEICQRVGYRDLSSFSRAFKTHFGFPPSQFSAHNPPA